MIWSTLFQQMKRLHCLLSSLNNAVGCRVFIVDLQNMALENYCSSWKTISTPWYFLAWIEPIWNEDAHCLATIAVAWAWPTPDLVLCKTSAGRLLGSLVNMIHHPKLALAEKDVFRLGHWIHPVFSFSWLSLHLKTTWLLDSYLVKHRWFVWRLALTSGSIDNHGIMASQS